ncbi:MAG: nuclease A inhibitor family protein [Chlorobiales bacterium]
MTKDELLAQLKEKISGLYFPSESDFPFEIVIWENFASDIFNTEKWLEHVGLPANSPLENTSIDYLFRNLSVEQAWHDDVQKEQVATFKALQEFLQAHLADLTVYRIGKIEITIFIIGKFGNDVIGLKTQAVET